MENFFADSKYALYFIGLFFIIIQNRVDGKDKTDKNIILIYIIYSLTNIFNIINILPSTLIVIGICLIELQVLMLNEVESILLVSTRYKIIDFIFNMINKYNIVQVIILNILFSMFLDTYKWNSVIAVVIFIMEAILFFMTLSKIYINKFRIKKLDEVEKEFLELSKGFNLKDEYLSKKIDMLTDIEDKTFFIRATSYISISIEALLYKVSKNEGKVGRIYEVHNMTNVEKIKYIRNNFKRISKLSIKIMKTVLKAIFSKNGVKRYIKRGYSTIEMQLMRQMAIETGYEKTYTRKIYEFIYTHMFFRSLDTKRRINNYTEHSKTFKSRIAYVYFKKVPTFLNTSNNYRKCKNIYAYYKIIRSGNINCSDLKPNKIVYALLPEEMFIFILGLSGKPLNEYTFNIYSNCIEKYNLDMRKIKEIVNKIDSFI